MSIESITADLREYIRKQYRIAEDDPDFGDNVHLYDYGYVDSFGAVQLRAFVASKFSVNMEAADSSHASLNSIREIAAFVSSRQNRN